MKRAYCVYIFFAALSLCLGCGSPKKGIKVAATAVPHMEILEVARQQMGAQGKEVELLCIDDYRLPNRLLQEGEVDANFFQHLPYLEEESQQCGYDFVVLTPVHIEPMGLYSSTLQTLDALEEGARVALPNDPTNEERALLLFQSVGLISLNFEKGRGLFAIEENPKKLRFCELDAAMLTRTLSDAALAAIPRNYALQARLGEPLALEGSSSPYVNIVVVRRGEDGGALFQSLKEALHSQAVRDFIAQRYCGAVLPV